MDRPAVNTEKSLHTMGRYLLENRDFLSWRYKFKGDGQVHYSSFNYDEMWSSNPNPAKFVKDYKDHLSTLQKICTHTHLEKIRRMQKQQQKASRDGKESLEERHKEMQAELEKQAKSEARKKTAERRRDFHQKHPKSSKDQRRYNNSGATAEKRERDLYDAKAWARKFYEQVQDRKYEFKRNPAGIYPFILTKPWEIFPEEQQITDVPVIFLKRYWTSGYIPDMGHSKIKALWELAKKNNQITATYGSLFYKDYRIEDGKNKKMGWKDFYSKYKNNQVVLLTCGCSGGSSIPRLDDLSKYFQNVKIVTNFFKGQNCGCSTLRRMEEAGLQIDYGILR